MRSAAAAGPAHSLPRPTEVKRSARRPPTTKRLAARVAPPLPPSQLVRRPRVRELLDEAVPLGVALVIAPGGFGKTVALAEFAREAGFPVAWLSLSRADADPAAFVEALCQAIGRVVPGFGKGALQLARQLTPENAPLIGEELAAELGAHAGSVGLVLDDFQAVDGAREVSQIVGALLQRGPPNAFFAIASRTLPDLPHARLLAAGRMVGVGAEDLRFAPAEVAAFVGEPSESERVTRLHDATGGWIAAMLLDDEKGSFVGTLDDYLEAEILAPQPREVRRFLLKASVPPVLTVDLCERVLDEPMGPTHLARAHRVGLFVAALPDGGWRLHDIFRDFLRARLRREDGALWRGLNRAVADEMAAAGQYGDAVTLLLDARLFPDAADMLAAGAETLAAQGRWAAIRSWTDRLPKRVLETRPRLLTMRGLALTSVAEPEPVLRVLDRALELCLAQEDTAGAAEALVRRAMRSFLSGHLDEALADCARARELLGEREHPVQATQARIEGTILARRGRFEEARDRLERAVELARRFRNRAEGAQAERALGWLDSQRGDLGAAASRYERTLNAFRALDDLSATAEVTTSLGHVYREQGADDLARRSFDEAYELAERVRLRRIRAYALDNLAFLDREAGHLERALERFGEALQAARDLDETSLVIHCLDGLAQTHRLLEGDGATAEALAWQALAEAERVGYVDQACQARVTLAAALLAQGRIRDARRLAHEAAARLAEAPPDRNLVRALLCAAAAGDADGAPDWIDDLRRAAEALARTASRGFLRAEVGALGPRMQAMAAHPAAAADVEAILRAAAALPGAPPIPLLPAAAQRGLPRIQARLLGRPEVLVEDAPPRDPGRYWTRHATRELFYLLEAHRAGLSADALIDRLFPEADPGRGKAQLWNLVNRLRAALSGGEAALGRAIVLGAEGIYRLNPDLQAATDVAEFEALTKTALAAPHGTPEEAAALVAAKAAYGGAYLDGVESSWVIGRRRQLARLYARVLRRLVEHAITARDVENAVELAEQLMRLEPLSEHACALLLRALVEAGERDRARLVYAGFKQRLDRALDAEPAPALARLVGLSASS